MFEIALGLAVLIALVAVPPLRRAALSFFGLFAITALGVAGFSVLVWVLYESKPLLTAKTPTQEQQMLKPESENRQALQIPPADLTAELVEEEKQEQKDEEESLKEEGTRTSDLAARARIILEEDRKLAEQAASFPLPVGIGSGLADIISVRIPAWRDKVVAAQQAESIRTWLQSLGLSEEETVSIVTAKAWGSLYDMWVAENPNVAPPRPQIAEPEAAPTSPPTESEPPKLVEISQEPPTVESQTQPDAEIIRRPPTKRRVISRPPLTRRPPQRRPQPGREVGPFGY